MTYFDPPDKTQSILAVYRNAVRIVARPKDNKCEGCGGPIGVDFDETEDMVTLCAPCLALDQEEPAHD